MHEQAGSHAVQHGQHQNHPAKLLAGTVPVAGLAAVHFQAVAHQEEEVGEADVHRKAGGQQQKRQQENGGAEGVAPVGYRPGLELTVAGKFRGRLLRAHMNLCNIIHVKIARFIGQQVPVPHGAGLPGKRQRAVFVDLGGKAI